MTAVDSEKKHGKTGGNVEKQGKTGRIGEKHGKT